MTGQRIYGSGTLPLRMALRIKSMDLPIFIVNVTDVRMFWGEGGGKQSVSHELVIQ